MAKSARASSKKANRTKLRARVFGPADKARNERIHAKLLETIQQSKPATTEMDTTHESTAPEAAKEDDFSKDMDVDGAVAKPASTKSSKDKRESKKQLRRKPQNKMTFPASRGKGALKPFTGGKVNKRR